MGTMRDNDGQVSRRRVLRNIGATGSIELSGLAGCLTSVLESGSGSGPIKIGALEPQSGSFAPWAAVHLPGLQLAVDEVNQNGGVVGRDLEVVVGDTKSDPSEAASLFRRFAEQKNVAVTTGAVSSDVGIRLAQTAETLEVPHYLHMAGSNKVIRSNTKHVFRVGLVPAKRFVQAQTAIAESQGYNDIAAIVADYAWGQSIKQGIENNFSVDVDIHVAPLGTSDFGSYIRKFSDDVEMVIASGHPPGAPTIANQTFELGYSPEAITGPSNPPQVLGSALNDSAIQAFVHGHNSNPYEQAFKDVGERFAENHDKMFNTHTAYGYVTGKLIARAIEEAGEATPTAIADATRDVELDTLFAEPIQYSEHGELEDVAVIFSYLRRESPSYDPTGGFRFEKVAQSEPLSALPADQ
jgi:branched-chain amino acid transport system substrate-binding protein